MSVVALELGPWAYFISNVGFPVFVAMYVLMRLEPIIKQLHQTVMILTIVVAKMNNIDYEEACKFVGNRRG